MEHVQLVGIEYTQYEYCNDCTKYSIYTSLSFSMISYFIFKYQK